MYNTYKYNGIESTIRFPPDRFLHLSTGSTSTWIQDTFYMSSNIQISMNQLTHIAVPISMVALPGVLKSTEPHQYTVYIHVYIQECRLMIEAREGPYCTVHVY